MTGRPWRIWLMCLVFLAVPWVLCVLKFDRFALISAPLYVLIAVGMFSVRTWGWYTSIGAAAVLFSLNTLRAAQLPWQMGLVLLVSNTIILVSAFLLFRRELMAPYFFPRLRWWESEERVRTQLLGSLHISDEVFRGEVSDISLSGCFVELTTPLSSSAGHQKPVLSIQLRGKVLTLPVLIMRISRQGRGAGCMFSASALHYKGQIESFIRELLNEDPYAMELKSLAEERFIRAKTGLKGFVIIQGLSYPVKVLDLSVHGARIAIREEVKELLELHLFHIEFHGIVIETRANIRHVGHHDSEFVIGLELLYPIQTAFQIRRLISSLKHAGYETVLRKGNPGDEEEKRKISPMFPFFGG
ncbi:MAG: PilZ domain-containing protein [Spirochaetales bacterium]|nr:PilZ domain-containing protein [Spirochaetales bacterium]